MTRRKSIEHLVLAGCVALFAAGCASTGDERASATGSQVEPASAEYAPSVESFTTRLEATQHLQSSGDPSRFAASRDSLVADVNQYIRSHPHAEDHPDFVQLLNALSALDTLALDILIEGDEDTALEDSLAIAGASVESGSVPAGPIFNLESDIFPAVENSRIDFWITYFTGPGRERFERALYRMQLHRPTVQRIINERELPDELICIAFIESGFAMKAVSTASAVGPWQFIRSTGRRYQLRINKWYDERCDVVASTYAACNYLNDLHGIWGDWYLAFAAYNCGEYRVARQVARQRTQDFWKLDLPLQTERYVPKFLAALYIMREPEKYGFTIPAVEPVRFDLVTVSQATDIDVLARCAGTTPEVVKELNPQLRRGATPPNMEIHVKVPVGAGETCAQNLAELPVEERVAWKEHKVRKGETLSQIASKYGTSVEEVRDANNLKRKSMLQIGQVLTIPVAGGTAGVASSNAETSKPAYMNPTSGINRAAMQRYADRVSASSTIPSDRKKLVYVVKPNDTLSEIAGRYRTSVTRIRGWNDLSRRRHIYPGQKLAIYVPQSYAEPDARDTTEVTVADDARFEKTKHVVERGESLYSISRQYNVSVQDLMTWNGRTRSYIRAGDVLVIWTPRPAVEARTP